MAATTPLSREASDWIRTKTKAVNKSDIIFARRLEKEQKKDKNMKH